MSLCECCGEPNGWVLMDPIYEFVCDPCVEEGAADMCENTGVYRVIKSCRCDGSGPANYDDGGGPMYYCGSTPWCCP